SPPEPAAPPPPKPARALDHPRFREASALCDRGCYSEARAILLELTRELPGSPQVRAHLHFAASGEHLGQGRAARAISELKRALAADPSFEPARRALARAVAEGLKRS